MAYRTAKVLENGTWVVRDFKEIKVGDQVRVFNADGLLVAEIVAESVPTACYPAGNFEFKAAEPSKAASKEPFE